MQCCRRVAGLWAAHTWRIDEHVAYRVCQAQRTIRVGWSGHLRPGSRHFLCHFSNRSTFGVPTQSHLRAVTTNATSTNRVKFSGRSTTGSADSQILNRAPFFSKWRKIWIRDVFWSQHLRCWGQNTSRIQNKEVYATLCLQRTKVIRCQKTPIRILISHPPAQLAVASSRGLQHGGSSGKCTGASIAPGNWHRQHRLHTLTLPHSLTHNTHTHGCVKGPCSYRNLQLHFYLC